MCEFVNPSILGNLTTFSRAFMQPINRSRDTSAATKEKQLGEMRSQELAIRTQNFVLRRSNDILLQYLPEKVEEVLFIPLTPIQAEIYRGLLRGKAIRQVLARTNASGNDALGQPHHEHTPHQRTRNTSR
jgi:SNF2 family DNA or RNA helicase